MSALQFPNWIKFGNVLPKTRLENARKQTRTNIEEEFIALAVQPRAVFVLLLHIVSLGEWWQQ